MHLGVFASQWQTLLLLIASNEQENGDRRASMQRLSGGLGKKLYAEPRHFPIDSA